MNDNPFADAQYEQKPSGYILMDGQEVAHTKQCPHCNAHFVSYKGSGKIRGYCLACRKVTCGAPACDIHVPFEVKLDLTDGGNVSTSGLMKRISPYKDEIALLTKDGRRLI